YIVAKQALSDLRGFERSEKPRANGDRREP
ncbi:MAG: hypothetical protein ACI8U4_000647, partial [Natronomonas sp.]